MSRREDTHMKSLPHFPSDALPPKAPNGQYPHDRNLTGLDHRYGTNKAVDMTSREYHEWRQHCSEEKRHEQVNKTAYNSCMCL